MFSLLQKFVVGNSAKVLVEPPSMPIMRVPQQAASNTAVPSTAEAASQTESNSFSCLNDVFGELLEDQVSYALSKW